MLLELRDKPRDNNSMCHFPATVMRSSPLMGDIQGLRHSGLVKKKLFELTA